MKQVLHQHLTHLAYVALAVGVAMTAGCAGIERTPQGSVPAATPADTVVASEERRVTTATPHDALPSPAVQGGAAASVPSAAPAAVVRPAAPARAAPTAANPPPPVTPIPPARAKVAAAPSPVAPSPKTQPPPPAPTLVKPAVAPPLDLKSLESRLKETKAIGVFTKLSLKNQIDDLLERFRAFHQGRLKTSLVELRRSFDMLVMKTIALLQDADPPLAGALASSRESIWGILSDRAKFATV